ncbi:MAG: transglycosylase SLT domain-containing protein [Candidatus Omnitrophota bacterium]
MKRIYIYAIAWFFMLLSSTYGGDCLPGTEGVVWSIDEVAGLASQKFSCDDLAQAIALAYAESGFKPFCVSANSTPGMKNYSEDCGLWQMNDLREDLNFEYGSDSREDQRNPCAHRCGLNPECNLDYTYRLWQGDKGFTSRRWHAYQTERYFAALAVARQFLRDHPEYLEQCH